MKKSVDNDVICIHDSESEDKKNKKKINNHSVESNSNEALDKSKLNTNVTQPNEFVKMVMFLMLVKFFLTVLIYYFICIGKS